MTSFPTAWLCDANPELLTKGDIRILPPIFKIYGQLRAFSGPIVTLKVFEDNVMVRDILESPGEGYVLLIDGGGSTNCSLLGGNLVEVARNRGWAGIVVNGCVRDVDEINKLDIGVRALGTHPLKANKKKIGEKHASVNVAGTVIHDGEWLYADCDGVLVSTCMLSI